MTTTTRTAPEDLSTDTSRPWRHGPRRHGTGFWLIAGAFMTAMAFNTAPTPLYPLYQARDGFSTLMVTIVFAVFALGVMTSLLLLGHVSDWVGRRRILLIALVVELVSAAIFIGAPSLAGLLVARLVGGIGVGMITATATAYLHELHGVHRPQAGAGRFEIVSTFANLGGLGAGSLIAGALAQFVDLPLRTPYLVFGALMLVSLVAVAFTPETVEAPLVRPTYRPQRIAIVASDRAGYLAAAAGGFAAFAILGVFTSLSGSFVGGELHHTSRLLAGAVVFAVFGAATVAQVMTNRLGLHVRVAGGLVSAGIGLIVLAAGIASSSLAGFLVGGILAGAGAGVLFKSAIGSMVAMADADKRGEALSGLFLIAYLGMSLPAIGLGLAVQKVSLTVALYYFCAAIFILLAAVGMLNVASRRAGRAAVA